MPVFAPGERARPARIRTHRRAWVLAVGTVCFGAFMGQLDASVVALTYDAIGTSFRADLQAVQWVSLTYLVALGGLLIPLGRLSDRLGRKRVYLWGFALFTAASAACAAAPSLLALSATRAVQGAGAAMLQANSVAIVSTAAPANRLRTALSIQATAQALGLALGPTLGGLLVQSVGWRWVFGLNVPIGLIALAIGRYLLPRSRLHPGARHGIGDAARAPGVPRGLAGALLAYLLLFGPLVLVPVVLHGAGVPAALIGLVVAALPAGFALGALANERLLPRAWSPARRCRLGIIATAAGLAGLLPATTHLGAVATTLMAAGIGLGVFTPTNNALIMRAAPTRAAGTAGGLVSAARAAGTAAGTALVATTAALASHGLVTIAALLALTAVAALSVPAPGRTRYRGRSVPRSPTESA